MKKVILPIYVWETICTLLSESRLYSISDEIFHQTHKKLGRPRKKK